ARWRRPMPCCCPASVPKMAADQATVREPIRGTRPQTWSPVARCSMVPEPPPPPANELLRPRDLALLLLASGDLRPRKRARDQQADRVGLDLKHRILQRLAALDPEPEALEAAL